MSSTSYILSVRNALGVAVGQADSLTENRVSFDMTHPITIGEVMEFRMELPRANETVLGELRAISGTGPPGSLVRYRAEIVMIDPRDAEIFAGWVDRTREGRPADDLRARVQGINAESGMHGATAEETEAALKRIEERKQRMAAIREQEKALDESAVFVPGLFEQQPVGTVPPVRARAAVRPAQGVAPSPLPPPVARPGGPWVDLQTVRGARVLAVAWMNREQIGPRTAADLESGRLSLPLGASPDWPPEVTLRLVMPDGTDASVPALLETIDGGLVCYRLDCDAALRKKLARALG